MALRFSFIKKYFFIFLMVFCSAHSYAQNLFNPLSDSYEVLEKDHLSFRWAPLSLIEPHTSTLRLSVEYIPRRLKHKVGFKFDFGLGVVSDSLHTGPPAKEYRYEARYYLHPDDDVWDYLSIEYFFIDHELTKSNGTFEGKDEERYYFSTSDIIIQTRGGNLKWGKSFYLTTGLSLDLYGGLGIRFIDVSHNPVIIDRGQLDSELESRHSLKVSDMEGTRSMLNVAAGFQIGYRFLL